MFIAVTVGGYGGLVWIALAAPLAHWAKLPVLRTMIVTAGCVWTSDLLATGLKATVDRPRPFQVIAEPEPLITGTIGSSCPSGHAATSAAGAVILSVLVGRGVWRWLVPLALVIGFSRVYVGVHYPGDVLAGALLGAAVSLGFLRLLRLTSADPRQSVAAPPPG